MGEKAVFLLLLRQKSNSFVECATVQAKEVRMKTMACQQVSFDLLFSFVYANFMTSFYLSKC